jgi:alpha-galactosidase
MRSTAIQFDVAQVANLSTPKAFGAVSRTSSRQGRPAGWKPALRQIGNLRYAKHIRFMSLKVCLTVILLALGVGPSFAQEAQSVWVSSLNLAPVVQGWGKPKADQSVTGQPLAIAGRRFEHGVGTHADSSIWLDLKGGSERFSAFAGVDDDAGNSRASVRFHVIADGKTLWQSPVMHWHEAARPVDLDVRGVKTLLLLVDMADDGGLYDHADWAEAKLLVKGERPVIGMAPREAAVVLTPKPPHVPRINGARIFGVRPGHPFLFTIPVTGDRPMTYAVEGLPKGLAVDATNGQITGRLTEPGEYKVMFRVSNALGSATRSFKIVCGETLALTPHMGWNSWYVWKSFVTDRIMRAAADAMVSSGMMDHGYQYVNIDDCWAIRTDAKDPQQRGQPRDAQGRINGNAYFPDMKAMTDYIHAKGLKAGIYSSPGPLTCAGYTGSWQHEAQDAQRFAEWGFDFLKYDWCTYSKIAKDNSLPELQKPYLLMGKLLREQNRDLVLNLCQYGNGSVWQWGKQVGGHSWRTADDLGGFLRGGGKTLFRDIFDLYPKSELHRYGGPGGWNDPDYLLLGNIDNREGHPTSTPLSPNEQYTYVSLWCLVAAPLIFSGDMAQLDEFTLSLMTNDEVIDVDQDPLGRPGHRAAVQGDAEIWVRDMEDGSKTVGLFNRGEAPAKVVAHWADLGLTGKQRVRDLWRQKDLAVCSGEFAADVPRHGVVLIRLWSQDAAQSSK